MADHVEVVDVAVPVEGVIPVETGQVCGHAGRYEVVDAGTLPVAAPAGVLCHGVVLCVCCPLQPPHHTVPTLSTISRPAGAPHCGYRSSDYHISQILI